MADEAVRLPTHAATGHGRAVAGPSPARRATAVRGAKAGVTGDDALGIRRLH
jgi:hypothetical protein